jgi:hypothetical protein
MTAKAQRREGDAKTTLRSANEVPMRRDARTLAARLTLACSRFCQDPLRNLRVFAVIES